MNTLPGTLHRVEVTGVRAVTELLFSFDGLDAFNHREAYHEVRGIQSLQDIYEGVFEASSDGFMAEDIIVYLAARELVSLRPSMNQVHVFGRETDSVGFLITELRGSNAVLASDDAILANPSLMTPRVSTVLKQVAPEEAAQFSISNLKMMAAEF